MDIDLSKLEMDEAADNGACRSVVRLTTSCWKDAKGGIHITRSILPLKRKSFGFQILQEDSDNIGADEVIHAIRDIYKLRDGVYSVNVCNPKYCYETGYLEEYDYQLNPFEDGQQ